MSIQITSISEPVIEYPLYFVQDDTWLGFSFQVQIGASYLDLSFATAEMQVRQSSGSPVLLDLSTMNGGITFLPDPTKGVVLINPVLITFGPSSLGPYRYDIPITLENQVITYIGGFVYVRPKVTHA